jgi:hypothetical protein
MEHCYILHTNIITLFKGARAGERTPDLLTSFIFSFHHFTAELQWLPNKIHSLLIIRTHDLKTLFSGEPRDVQQADEQAEAADRGHQGQEPQPAGFQELWRWPLINVPSNETSL